MCTDRDQYTLEHEEHVGARFHRKRFVARTQALKDQHVVIGRAVEERRMQWIHAVVDMLRVDRAVHDRLRPARPVGGFVAREVRPQIAGRSEEHTSELQSLMRISYAVFCLKKKKQKIS